MDNFNFTTKNSVNSDDIEKPSPILILFLNKACDIFLWVSFFLSTVVFITLLVVIKKKSPKKMRIYKWYLMSNVVATYTYDFFMQACMHPTAILPTSNTILVTNGLLKILRNFQIDFYAYSHHIIIFIFIIWYYILDLMFLYRYAQTTNHLFFKKFLEKWWSLLIHIIILAIIIGLILWSNDFEAAEAVHHCLDQHKLYQNNSDVNCTQFLDESTNAAFYMGNITMDSFSFIGNMKISPISTIIYAFVSNICGALVLYTTYKIYATFKKYKKNFTKKIYTMYRNFTNALLIEIIITFALLVIPITALILSNNYLQSYISILSPVLFCITGLFPLVSNTFILVYIKSYRIALKDFFNNIKNFVWKKNHSAGPTMLFLKTHKAKTIKQLY